MKTAIREKIIWFVKARREVKIGDLIKMSGFSRAYLNKILSGLLAEKKIMRLGQTNQVRYILYDEARLEEASLVWRRHLANKDLQEDEVWRELKNHSRFLSDLPDAVVHILEYSFEEMLNNAIEHSGSKDIIVEFRKEKGKAMFIVNDFGVGVFNKIMRSRGLKNEQEAIQDLLKGKQTTAREFHSGEGIFFTSKAADVFSLISEGTEMLVDNDIDDVSIRRHRSKRGTKVIFSIRMDTDRKLTDIFRRFSGAEEGFTKTEIKVKLYALDASFVSRSQARRLMAGLEKFKEIVLDFDKVEAIGQGFADEIFRVYKNSHPDKDIDFINANPEVRFMINRVEI